MIRMRAQWHKLSQDNAFLEILHTLLLKPQICPSTKQDFFLSTAAT